MEKNTSDLTILQIYPKKRSDDRFISSQVINLTFGQQELKLVCVVEIINHWNHAREIGTSLGQIFAEYFNQSRHQSILTRFEDALKQINQDLISAQSKVGTTISCLLALHVGTDIYFSTVGSIKIILIRDGKLTSAVVDKRDEVNEFTSVTSGTLDENNWIIYANDNLFALARRILVVGNTLEPKEIEEQLRQQSSETDGSVLVGCAVEYRKGYGFNSVISLGNPTSKLPVEFKLPKIPFDYALWSNKIKAGLAKFSRKHQAKLLDKSSDHQPTAIVADQENSFATSSEELASEPEFKVLHYQPDSSPKTQKNKDKQATKFGFSSYILWAKINFRKIRHPIIAIVVFLVILSGIGYFGYQNFQKHNANTTPAKPVVPALITALKTATPEQARVLIANGLTPNRYQLLSASDQKNLVTLATKAGVTIAQLPSAPLFSTDTGIAQIAVTPHYNYVYAIDSTGQLWFWDGKTVSKVAQANLIAQPVSITALAKNAVLVSDSLGNIYLFDGSAAQPIELVQPTNWASGIRYLANFNSNLYVLTASDGAVHKVPGFINSIGNDSVIVNTTLAASDKLLSFLINGDVQTLTTATGLVDHPRSKTAVTLVAPNLTGSSSSATFSATSLIVSNGALISTYSATGVFQSANAYILSSPVTETAENSPQGLLVVIGKNVYEVK